MDPYEVLGISPSCSNGDVNKAYTALAKQTHPDKVKNQTNMFLIIKKAYDTIYKERRHLSNAPFEKVTYEQYPHKGDTKVSKNSVGSITPEKFNAFYDKHSRNLRSAGYIEGTSKSNSRESDDELYDKPLHTKFERGIVKHRIPRALETSYFMNCEQIGVHAKDKSTTHGFDYRRAHTDVEKTKDAKQKYLSIEECISEREREEKFVFTREDEKAHAKIKKKIAHKESLRMIEKRRQDSERQDHDDGLNNILRETYTRMFRA